MAKAKSFKLSELIMHLEDVKAEHGDIPVIYSKDEEGNGYNTINEDSITVDCGLCIIYPARERLELDEISGFKNDEWEDEEDEEYEELNFDDE